MRGGCRRGVVAGEGVTLLRPPRWHSPAWAAWGWNRASWGPQQGEVTAQGGTGGVAQVCAPFWAGVGGPPTEGPCWRGAAGRGAGLPSSCLLNWAAKCFHVGSVCCPPQLPSLPWGRAQPGWAAPAAARPLPLGVPPAGASLEPPQIGAVELGGGSAGSTLLLHGVCALWPSKIPLWGRFSITGVPLCPPDAPTHLSPCPPQMWTNAASTAGAANSAASTRPAATSVPVPPAASCTGTKRTA